MTTAPTLREAQRAKGAVFRSEGGDDDGLPLHFGSPRDEFLAAKNEAALLDFSDRTLLQLTGADRVKFLHGFCTNDIKRLAPGQVCEAFLTNVKGKVVGHVWVSAGESALWLDADPGTAERIIPHLERYIINEDVAIADQSTTSGQIFVLGPEAGSSLARIGIDVAGLENLRHRPIQVLGTHGGLRRFDVDSTPGYMLIMARERLGELWTRLCDAGIRPAGSEIWTSIRIEAGLPLYGVDITGDNLAQEVGRTKSAISFTKGCYLGQEPIARIDAMGHVNRQLRSLRLSSGPIPAAGSSVFADPSSTQIVGTVTSVAISYRTEMPVAIAVLRLNALNPGAQVWVKTDQQNVSATVFWPPSENN